MRWIILGSSKSSDVGVQATPAAVASDFKPQPPGILPVTSAMIQNASHPQEAGDRANHTNDSTRKAVKTPMCLINELARFNKVLLIPPSFLIIHV